MSKKQNEFRSSSDLREGLLSQIAAYDGVVRIAPEQIKLKSKLGLELLWNWAIALSAIAGVLFLSLYLDHQTRSLLGAWLCGGAFLVFVCLRVFTSNYFIVDLETRQVLHHKKFLGRLHTDVISAFSELSAVVVKVDKDTGGRRVSWSYQPVLVTQEGKEYSIIDESSVWKKSLDDFAYKLGEILDIPAFPSRQQECTHIIFDPYEKRITIEYHPDPPSSASANIKILIRATIAFLVFFGLFAAWAGKC